MQEVLRNICCLKCWQKDSGSAGDSTRDFHATVLHMLGFDHQRFTIRSNGLDLRLTGVEPARVVQEWLA